MKKFLLLVALAGLLGATAFAQRDPLIYPFAKTSVWNMPLHDNAQYTSAGINILGYFYDDDNQLILTPTAPMTNIQQNTVGWGGGRCNVGGDGTVLDTVPIPANFVINDVTTGGTPNNSAAILMPDTETIHQNQPFQRCTAGSYAISQYIFPQDNIVTGTGQLGAHGGSGMSSLGGTIRVGELVPGGVIHHALEMGLMQDFLDKANSGYRWPAVTADGNDSCYNSTNPNMLMGVLLALPPSFNVSSLSTQPAQIIATALQNYGAYVVDTVACGTSWQGTTMMIENGPAGSAYTNFKNTWGYTFDGQGIDATHTTNQNAWIADMYNIVTHLEAVSNNDANDIGGGPTTDLVNRRVTTLCDPGTEGTGNWCTTVPVTGVTVSPTSASIAVNGTQQLTATISPSNATNKNVTWSSSNTSIATVNTSGLVTGVATGNSNVTVTTQDGDFSEYSEITVTNVSVTGVTVSPTSASIAVNGTQQLTATILPSNATNKNVTWSSSNTAIATVSSSGLVTGVAAGSATITVTTSDGGFHATSAITVTSGGGGGTISFVGRTQANTNTGSTSVTISTPSGIASGELMLVTVINYGGSTPATPSGWTLLGSTTNSANDNVAVFYKTWTTGSATSYTFGSGNLGWPKAVMRVYSGVSAIDASSPAPATSGTNTNGTSFALPALSATATANEEYVGFYACDNCSTISGPSGLGDGTSDATQWSSYDGDLLYASSGSSVPAKTATASTGGNWVGFAVTLKTSGSGSSVSFIGRTQASVNTGSTSVTISTPSGIANGELMLVAVTNFGSTPATPSGWTKLASTSNSVNDNVAVFYETWTTGSPTSYTFGSGNLGWPKAVMRVYSGTSLGIDALSAAPATSGTNTNGTSFALPALSATATANEEYVGFYACDTCSTITGPSGLGDGTSNTTQWSSYDGDLLYASAGSSVPAKTATASTGGNWIGFAVTVK